MWQPAVGLNRRQRFELPSFQPKLLIAPNWTFSKDLCVTLCRWIHHCVCGGTKPRLGNKRPTCNSTNWFFFYPSSSSCNQITINRWNHLRLLKHALEWCYDSSRVPPAQWACGFWSGKECFWCGIWTHTENMSSFFFFQWFHYRVLKKINKVVCYSSHPHFGA